MPRGTTPIAMPLGDSRNPVMVRHEGDRTIVEFDHTYLAPEATEKGNHRIASTLGNKEVVTADGTRFHLSLNAYRKA